MIYLDFKLYQCFFFRRFTFVLENLKWYFDISHHQRHNCFFFFISDKLSTITSVSAIPCFPLPFVFTSFQSIIWNTSYIWLNDWSLSRIFLFWATSYSYSWSSSPLLHCYKNTESTDCSTVWTVSAIACHQIYVNVLFFSIVLVVSMLYLSCVHLHRLYYDYGSSTLDITG